MNAEMQLPIRADLWESQVFPPPGVAAEAAASFAIAVDPDRGPCLVIGPWRQGSWGARYWYREALPQVRATVHGWYRTEGEEPAATVLVEFVRGGRRVYLESKRLPPSPDWAPFEVSFWRTPPTAEAVRIAVGLARQTDGRALFADLRVSPEAAAPTFPERPPAVTRPAPPSHFSSGERFRIEHCDDVWWLVGPSGRAFYSVGTDGPWRRQGADQAARDREDIQWLRRLRANSLAGWTDVQRWARINDELMARGERPFATFLTLETGFSRGEYDHLLDARGQGQASGHQFPDPFDPRFAEAYRARVHRVAELVRGKPWHAAWFIDNELSHRDLPRYVYSPHCAAALRDFLAARYGDIAALNRAWGTDLASFDAILAEKPEPGKSAEAMSDDFRAFAREIVKKYVGITVGAIRAEDPGALVFSNRFMFGDFDYLDLYAPCDAIAINRYPENDEPGLSEETVERLRAAHELTGKPIIIGEWSVPALDSGLYNNPEHLDWSFPETVPTQTDRARQAACVTIDFYNLPFVIGAHWFIWYDFDSEKRQANRGLFTVRGEPYIEVIDALARAHEQIGAAVLADPYSRP